MGDPEIVFKFRHPDLQKCADMDVRPQIAGDHRIKFKAEALPLKDQLGGVRMLYSHNAQFPLSHVHAADKAAMATLLRLLPPLRGIKTSHGREGRDRQPHGGRGGPPRHRDARLRQGGARPRPTWRSGATRGDEKQLVGEFAYQCKFEREDERHAVAMKRAEQLFILLQETASDWLSLGTTKTGTVYRLKGNPPTAHE